MNNSKGRFIDLTSALKPVAIYVDTSTIIGVRDFDNDSLPVESNMKKCRSVITIRKQSIRPHFQSDISFVVDTTELFVEEDADSIISQITWMEKHRYKEE